MVQQHPTACLILKECVNVMLCLSKLASCCNTHNSKQRMQTLQIMLCASSMYEMDSLLACQAAGKRLQPICSSRPDMSCKAESKSREVRHLANKKASTRTASSIKVRLPVVMRKDIE